MTELQIYLTVGVFTGVIFLIALDVIDMAVEIVWVADLMLPSIWNGHSRRTSMITSRKIRRLSGSVSNPPIR